MNHRGPSYGSNVRPAGAGANSGTRPVGEYRTGRPVPSDDRPAERLKPRRYNSAPEPTYGPQPDPLNGLNKPVKRKRNRTKMINKQQLEAAKQEAARRGIL